MATPYFQLRVESALSTQDLAQSRLEDLPVLVIAPRQTAGRGRSGSHWITADRALAVSLAFHSSPDDGRPFSLMAGVAAARVTEGTELKWPNDLLKGGRKVGGILVERSSDTVVVGFGLNLWWPSAPEGMAGVLDTDPGEEHYAEVGGLWGAEMMELLDGDGWPREEYKRRCVTLGKSITWEPDGLGTSVDVAEDGGLVVERDGVTETIYSGVVRHVGG